MNRRLGTLCSLVASLALLACSTKGGETPPPDSGVAADAGGDAPPAVAPLARPAVGNYRGVVSTRGDTCAGAFDYAAGAPTVSWKGDNQFTLTYYHPDRAVTCTAGTTIACTSFPAQTSDAAPDAKITQTLESLEVSEVTGSTFKLRAKASASCAGAGCAAVAAEGKLTFPCGATIEAVYTLGGCDVVAANCTDPKAPKCAMSYEGASEVAVESCTPSLGNGKLGEPCTRPKEVVGSDTCGPGLFCSGLNHPKSTPQERECRLYCAWDTVCPTGTACQSLSSDNRLGFCGQKCVPFGGGCASGNSCKPAPLVGGGGGLAGFCNLDGTSPAYAACKNVLDCGADTTCREKTPGSGAMCSPYCDATHPCADAAATCTPFASPELAKFGSCLK